MKLYFYRFLFYSAIVFSTASLCATDFSNTFRQNITINDLKSLTAQLTAKEVVVVLGLSEGSEVTLPFFVYRASDQGEYDRYIVLFDYEKDSSIWEQKVIGTLLVRNWLQPETESSYEVIWLADEAKQYFSKANKSD